MLFNSYEFLFAFLPLTLLAFFVLGRVSRDLALGWLILASLVFYAWWRPINVPIIAVSLAINFGIARLLQRLGADEENARWRSVLLIGGIAFNIAFLGYFKYTNFLLTTIHDITGSSFILRQIVLPLGLSFITFQKIAFLLDVHAGRVEHFTLRDYLLFVLFFPQLIAGPIVHYREMMPQFHANPCRFDRSAFGIGLTMIAFGLFKKVVLADGMAGFATPIYAQAAAAGHVSLLPAWTAAVGFTLQIYFDFSGYSDMAAGLARCIGVRLPLNFYSPLQSSSIIEFWSRWHVTLTRFLTAYLYNPMLLALTRRRIARGLVGGHKTSARAFIELLAAPTLVTMFVSGVWHGAGYLFIIWGLLHGTYLVLNHLWRLLVPRLGGDHGVPGRLAHSLGGVITFLAVIFSMVFFRAPTLHAAGDILAGMLGRHGVELPLVMAQKIGLGHLPAFVSVSANVGARELLMQTFAVIAVLLIALLLPNTIQLLRAHDPVLGAQERKADTGVIGRTLAWNPTVGWAIAVGLLAAIAVMRVGGPSEFLYWQF